MIRQIAICYSPLGGTKANSIPLQHLPFTKNPTLSGWIDRGHSLDG
jgi:hypothetical protein